MNLWLLVMCLAVQNPPSWGTNRPGPSPEPSRVVKLGGAKLVVVFLPRQGQEGIGRDEMAKRQVQSLALHRTYEKAAATLRDEGVEVVEIEASPVEFVSRGGVSLLQFRMNPGAAGAAAVMDPQSEHGRQEVQGEPGELVKRARQFFARQPKAK